MKDLVSFVGVLGILLVVCLVNPLIIYCLWDDTMVKFFEVKDVTFVDSFWISWISAAVFKVNSSSNRSK